MITKNSVHLNLLISEYIKKEFFGSFQCIEIDILSAVKKHPQDEVLYLSYAQQDKERIDL